MNEWIDMAACRRFDAELFFPVIRSRSCPAGGAGEGGVRVLFGFRAVFGMGLAQR
jgi:hypothetical protein